MKKINWQLCVLLVTLTIVCSCKGNDLQGDRQLSKTPYEYTPSAGIGGDSTQTMSLPTETNAMGFLDFPRLGYNENQWVHYPLAYDLGTGYTSNIIREVEYAKNLGLWFSTPTSVWCYIDGEWRMFTEEDGLLSSDSNALTYDPSGKIWVGTSEGISVFDGNEWINYPKGEGLLSGFLSITDLEISKNMIWVVYSFSSAESSKRVSSYDGTDWVTYEFGDNTKYGEVYAVESTPDGDVWFGTWREGVFRFDGQDWTHYPVDKYDEGIILSEHARHVSDIKYYDSGELWILTTNLGMTLVSESGWDTISFEQLGYGAFFSFDMALDGTIWVGGELGNALRAFRDGEWYYFYYGDLPFTHINDIEITPDGEIWLATTNGVFRYSP